MHDRKVFYQIIHKVFKLLEVSPAICELGVLDGGNAVDLCTQLDHKYGLFIDAWSSNEITKNYSVFDQLPDWTLPIESFANYFGGSLSNQITFDKLYSKAKKNLSRFKNIDIKRNLTHLEFKVQEQKQARFEYIYRCESSI